MWCVIDIIQLKYPINPQAQTSRIKTFCICRITGLIITTCLPPPNFYHARDRDQTENCNCCVLSGVLQVKCTINLVIIKCHGDEKEAR